MSFLHAIADFALHYLRSPRRGLLSWQMLRAFRLMRRPRRVPGEAGLGNRRWHFADAASLASAWIFYFVEQKCRFEPSKKGSVIIDCGANVGVSVRYWKHLDRNARVIAFEPDPNLFELLCRNTDDLQQIELHAVAVSDGGSSVAFHATGCDAGHVVSDANTLSHDLVVKAHRLSEILRDASQEIDLLKIDIEGAETNVIVEAADELWRVKRVFVEYHDRPGETQRLSVLLDQLHQTGFRSYVHSDYGPTRPFVEWPIDGGMDQRLLIFATRTPNVP